MPDTGDQWFGGICAGFAYAVGIPTWIVRIASIVLILWYGVGFLPYFLLWVFAPEWPDGEPADYDQIAG